MGSVLGGNEIELHFLFDEQEYTLLRA